MARHAIKILLVDDQEDDYVIFKDTAEQVDSVDLQVEWVDTPEGALSLLKNTTFDVCFVDYRLGHQTGLDVLDAINKADIVCPVIILTGLGDREIDEKAMRMGAADYLEKDLLSPSILERSVRYAMERTKNRVLLQNSEKRMHVVSARLIHTHEEERKEIARELHDNIGGNLAGVKLELEYILHTCRNENGATDKLKNTIQLIRKTMQDLRDIYSDIRPIMLDDLGIITTVQWYYRKLSPMLNGIAVDLEIDVEESDIDPPLKIILFRILQESLANIIEHSGADHAKIRLSKKNNRIIFEISDNGVGFDDHEIPGSHTYSSDLGLSKMKERTEFIGGHFHIVSQKGKGTVVRASWDRDTMPLKEDILWNRNP